MHSHIEAAYEPKQENTAESCEFVMSLVNETVKSVCVCVCLCVVNVVVVATTSTALVVTIQRVN